jgi:hypothetical protein
MVFFFFFFFWMPALLHGSISGRGFALVQGPTRDARPLGCINSILSSEVLLLNSTCGMTTLCAIQCMMSAAASARAGDHRLAPPPPRDGAIAPRGGMQNRRESDSLPYGLDQRPASWIRHRDLQPEPGESARKQGRLAIRLNVTWGMGACRRGSDAMVYVMAWRWCQSSGKAGVKGRCVYRGRERDVR